MAHNRTNTKFLQFNEKNYIKIDELGNKFYYKPNTDTRHREGGPAIEFVLSLELKEDDLLNATNLIVFI